MIYVYVLHSLKDNGYYIGISKNLTGRLLKHNSGGVKSTKSRRPFELTYSESYDSYKSARGREIEFKSFKGGNKLKDILKI